MNNQIMRFIFLAVVICFQFGCGSNGGSSDSNTQTASAPGSNSSSSSSSNSVSSSSTSAADTSTLAQKIDAYLESNQGANLPGIAILIVKNGQLAYSGGKGMADITTGAKVSSHTGFRLASVSKPFTAIAIMQLVEKGQIKLSDSLLDYIPELPSSWRKITIEHLLTHRSGIYDIINDGWKPTVLNGLTNDSLLTYLIKNPALEFEPGTKGDYSNTGYMLLAKIIERRTGLSFSNYMALNVFGPANMRNSYITDENQAIKNGDALNYARLRTYYGIVTHTKGSMSQVSSTDDFFNFFEAVRTNKLVSANTWAEIIKPRGIIEGVNVNYGYGFFTAGKYLTHQGEWDGEITEVVMDSGKGLEWVMLTNSGTVGRGNIDAIKRIISATSF